MDITACRRIVLFPPVSTVRNHFCKWQDKKPFEQVRDMFRGLLCRHAGGSEGPGNNRQPERQDYGRFRSRCRKEDQGPLRRG